MKTVLLVGAGHEQRRATQPAHEHGVAGSAFARAWAPARLQPIEVVP